MRVLVTWGSKLGGTEGIARTIGEVLREAGHDVHLAPAAQVHEASVFDAVIVGGALYANRWHRDARRLVIRHLAALRRVPVWFFSSGPLDASADGKDIPPVDQVEALMERVGARAHVTFGGRLAPDAKGFPASAMAKTTSGDWRNPARIRAWAAEVAAVLPTAAPGRHVEPAGRSAWRLLGHGVVGALVCGTFLAGDLRVTSAAAALAWQALAAGVVFLAIALRYFRPNGARAAAPTALVFATLVLVLDLVVPRVMWRDAPPGGSVDWLVPLVVFGVTWATGTIRSFIPSSRPPRATPSASA
jgi:menaquinone-dependent protoporphyrinogen oxidase